MPIVKVKVDGIYLNAVLDTASSSSYITEAAVRRLKLKGKETMVQVETINGVNSRRTTVVSLEVLTMESKRVALNDVSVVEKIPVVSCVVHLNEYPHLKGLSLFNEELKVADILIGQDHGGCLIPSDARRGRDDEPYAVRYPLGWALGGRVKVSRGLVLHVSNLISERARGNDIDDDINRLWDMERGEGEQEAMSQDDRRVVRFWDEGTVVRSDRHYEIPIPFKDSACFTDNEFAAQQRLKSLIRSLHRKGMLDRYDEEMEKLVHSGYAEKVTESCGNENVWYLPHHGVVNSKKPGKLRIVFDCAAKHMGESLNDKCYQGPDLVNRLLAILLRFREHRYVIMADIEAMYYQVSIPREQRDVLRFLWLDRNNNNVMKYRMRRHVFGGVWCAASSTYALRRTVNDDPTVSALVRSVVLDSFYVDDCLVSTHDSSDIRTIFVEVTKQIAKGGFRLTKFVTNCEVAEEIPVQDRAKEINLLSEDSSAKALGIKWNVQGDYFGFSNTEYTHVEALTRRHMLSTVASIYDPLGLAAPVIIVGRLLFQDATRLKLGWDESVSPDLMTKWSKWINSLSRFSEVKIPRCIKEEDPDDVSMELHHFSDASQTAYGTCAYLRCVNRSGVISSNLIMSRSRVAPMKPVTIPRLELQAAVLSIKSDQIIRSYMSLKFSVSYYWTDSQIVIDYIRNSNRRFPVFVGNRVSKITDHSSPQQWRHVKGVMNPADVVSRGTTFNLLDQNKWFNGPDFLGTRESDWEVMCETPCITREDLECPVVCDVINLNTCKACGDNPLDRISQHYSSWVRMKRALAWIRRYIANLRTDMKQRGELSAQEIATAGTILVKHAQNLHYSRDIQLLKSNNNMRRSCNLKALSPYMDDEELVRVGGRLSHANVDNNHPVVVPFNHEIAKAIVRDAHDQSHLGVEWVLSIVRREYWIIKARCVIKPIIKSCVKCRKMYAKPCKQFMADLPPDRVMTSQPAFYNVGIDMFGPFYVKLNRSEVKRYVCIYTCMSTRAVHLEKTSAMDTDAFINSFRRFQARRGRPVKVYSDNGTNFVGGKAEMHRAQQELSESVIARYAANNDIEWHFNPPTASHMGGVWERMIRTVRRVMFAVIHERLTDEILDTVLCEVESIVNSRPLTKLTDSPEDAEPLTPNHLILLNGSCQPAPGSFRPEDVFRKRWRHVQVIAENFWKKFVKFYLPELQRRVKWTDVNPNLKPGDLVMLMDVLTPRNLWPIGLVQSVDVGRDGLVRSVKVKTKDGVYARPVVKIVLLEAHVIE